MTRRVIKVEQPNLQEIVFKVWIWQEPHRIQFERGNIEAYLYTLSLFILKLSVRKDCAKFMWELISNLLSNSRVYVLIFLVNFVNNEKKNEKDFFFLH